MKQQMLPRHGEMVQKGYLTLLAKIVVLLIVLIFTGCRSEKEHRATNIDLSKRLSYAEKSASSNIIVFGSPEAKQFLGEGWSKPAKDGKETFQSAVTEKGSIIFKSPKPYPTFLHLKLRSTFANSAQVLVNSKPIGTIQVDVKPKLYSFQVPAEALNGDTNVVELNWNELRKLDQRKNSPDVAAIAYYAVIGPAKYIANIPASSHPPLVSSSVTVGDKTKNAINQPLGGSVNFYEKLNKNSRLEFEMFYDPAGSKKDVFANFSITLRKDGQSDQQIFEKKATQQTSSRESILLSKYITTAEPQTYQIEFNIDRNSILDSETTAWIEPLLYQGLPNEPELSKSKIDDIRDANENANVIIVLLDAAGAKLFTTHGYQRETTPNIEKLFQEGVQFDKTYCQAVYTLASTTSMMTGLDPFRHQLYDRQNKLPDQIETLAERFTKNGYTTATFVANGNVSPHFGNTQGFQVVREVHNEPGYTGWASDITNRFTEWLQTLNRDKNFFVYLHYREPHGPFNPPKGFKHQFTDPNYDRFREASDEMRRKLQTGEVTPIQADYDFITAAYDENLRYGDYEVGRLMQKLKDMKLYDRTIVIVTADHGEAFWEHGFQGHNSQLYEESIHIPLIIKFASKTDFHGKHIKTPVRTIDLYPSLVDLLELPNNDMDVDGTSFIPYLISEKSQSVPIFCQTLAQQAYSYTEGNFKYIFQRLTGQEELYDLKNDPQKQI
ncbi:sulfatase-like hydrolase/transferase [bacterium]|nr:sulfatase-like hydrolase/transferase [bacterium]